MKKSLYILLAFAAVTITLVGCDKKKGGGGTAAYVPSACYNNGYPTPYGGGGYPNQGYPYGQQGYPYGQGGSYIGGVNGYQWVNGQCIDTRTGTVATQQACNNVTGAYSYNANCNYYGGQNYYGGHVSGAYNACSVYNTWNEQFYPVYYPNLGITVCAGYSAYNTMWSYGTPAYYGGYNNIYQGCVPGGGGYGSRCKCKSFGGTLGWFHAGVQLGVCY